MSDDQASAPLGDTFRMPNAHLTQVRLLEQRFWTGITGCTGMSFDFFPRSELRRRYQAGGEDLASKSLALDFIFFSSS